MRADRRACRERVLLALLRGPHETDAIRRAIPCGATVVLNRLKDDGLVYLHEREWTLTDPGRLVAQRLRQD